MPCSNTACRLLTFSQYFTVVLMHQTSVWGVRGFGTSIIFADGLDQGVDRNFPCQLSTSSSGTVIQWLTGNDINDNFCWAQLSPSSNLRWLSTALFCISSSNPSPIPVFSKLLQLSQTSSSIWLSKQPQIVGKISPRLFLSSYMVLYGPIWCRKVLYCPV